MKAVKFIECPRDAMQGIRSHFIPTAAKTRYINALLKVGFHTIDFGSFVSPRAVPQMRDTASVLEGLELSESNTRLLAIVANVRGAREALAHEEIQYLGYPFSISENFQMRNTGKTIEQSVNILETIQNLAMKSNRELVTYLSMGFGNPYGDPWNTDIMLEWTEQLVGMGTKIISLSDTIGSSTPDVIRTVFGKLIKAHPDIEFGAHLHTHPETWFEKVNAAFEGGCRRFDGAIKGYGGCPMARDELTGNMPTEKLLSYCNHKGIRVGLDPMAFEAAYNEALRIFNIS
jgi:hydroxymethylglutaryl-CoA lyase